ncbi:hypothetical protein GPECTOR_23g42 [Gonium pectorale]|uniref:Uncharacterized protein n=1 Tax=Gonium pectorale TaxID=33097 RepID=A0A150GGZ1_GONPE|nr:hypothetical protein GPECTOR_23g42 [Gonium pectorale]|eukprot:KXZ49112.1 hypothetical protein GPECTOR_23g42 [Gonium pectorale]
MAPHLGTPLRASPESSRKQRSIRARLARAVTGAASAIKACGSRISFRLRNRVPYPRVCTAPAATPVMRRPTPLRELTAEQLRSSLRNLEAEELELLEQLRELWSLVQIGEHMQPAMCNPARLSYVKQLILDGHIAEADADFDNDDVIHAAILEVHSARLEAALEQVQAQIHALCAERRRRQQHHCQQQLCQQQQAPVAAKTVCVTATAMAAPAAAMPCCASSGGAATAVPRSPRSPRTAVGGSALLRLPVSMPACAGSADLSSYGHHLGAYLHTRCTAISCPPLGRSCGGVGGAATATGGAGRDWSPETPTRSRVAAAPTAAPGDPACVASCGPEYTACDGQGHTDRGTAGKRSASGAAGDRGLAGTGAAAQLLSAHAFCVITVDGRGFPYVAA